MENRIQTPTLVVRFMVYISRYSYETGKVYPMYLL